MFWINLIYKLLRFCPKSQLFVKFCAFEVAKNRFYDIRNKIQKIPSNIQSISFLHAYFCASIFRLFCRIYPPQKLHLV